MSLTKEAIIEIQTSAKFNHERQVRLAQDKRDQAEAVEKALIASRKPQAVVTEEVAIKKGK